MPDRILLTTLEAARLMAVSTRTIFEWTSSGELEAVRLGRAVRYTRDELVRFVESKKTAAVK